MKADQEYLEGFEGIVENDKARRKMTAVQISIRLSKCTPGTPAYVLYEHELNRKIAHVQALPMYLSIIMTIVGLFLGWALAQWKPFESQTSLDIIAEHIKKHDASTSDKATGYSPAKTMEIRPEPKKVVVEPPSDPQKKAGNDNIPKQ